MKFFIPDIPDPEKAEQRYQSIKKNMALQGWRTTDRRIMSITFRENREIIDVTVGKIEPIYREKVIAILESANEYVVCTPNNGVLRGSPIRVSIEEVSFWQDFQS
jgi:hypothetical protein